MTKKNQNCNQIFQKQDRIYNQMFDKTGLELQSYIDKSVKKVYNYHNTFERNKKMIWITKMASPSG